MAGEVKTAQTISVYLTPFLRFVNSHIFDTLFFDTVDKPANRTLQV